MAHCRSALCKLPSFTKTQMCACLCQRCFEADAHGVHVHAHPYAREANTSDGWPPVAPVVQERSA